MTTTDTSIGSDEPGDGPVSGIDDEALEKKERRDGDPDGLTREDIEKGNDRNASADQLSRAGKTNKLQDDGIELGRP